MLIINILRRLFLDFFLGIGHLFCLIFILIAVLYVRMTKRMGLAPQKLVWGCTPLANNIYWSRAMKQYGFVSETFTDCYYETLHNREDWDLLMSEKYSFTPLRFKPYLAFIESIFRYDIFFISFDGFFLGLTPFWKLESRLLRISRKKIVVIPYGGDSFVYNRVRSSSLLHGLLLSYPEASKIQKEKSRRLDYWIANADFVMPAVMGIDGFGRWDVLLPSSLSIDLSQWKKSMRNSMANGIDEKVIIAHAPNHRGFKGTEFIIEVIKELQNEGYKVELFLIEKMKNEELRKKFETEVDILVEQIIAPSYGLNGIEGMASGLCVISNLEDDTYILPFRRWSFLSECPIVSGSPENLKEVLIKLIENPELRNRLGNASRQYVEKYHSLESCQYLFKQIIDFIYKRRGSLIDMYHPIYGEYMVGKAKIDNPLKNNTIVI